MPLNPGYIGDLQAHIRHIQAHSQGVDEGLWGPDELPYSNLPPNVVWTPEEKRLFFRALSRFSRLRPDLIAETIGSKSSLDVSLYIAALEKATRGHERPRKRDFAAAFLVDDKLVRVEEEQSAALIAQESEALSSGAMPSPDSSSAAEGQTLTDGRCPAPTVILKRKTLRVWNNYIRTLAFSARAIADSEGARASGVKRPGLYSCTTDDLKKLGVDAPPDVLHMFRLNRLADLMQTFSQCGNPDEADTPQPVNRVSLEVLLSLRAELDDWLVGAMRHVLSVAETAAEITTGRRESVAVILPSQVEEALAIYGYERRLKDVMRELPGRYNLVDDEEGPESQDESGSSDGSSEPPQRNPIHLSHFLHPQLLNQAQGSYGGDFPEGEEGEESDSSDMSQESDTDEEAAINKEDLEGDKEEMIRLKVLYGIKQRVSSRKYKSREFIDTDDDASESDNVSGGEADAEEHMDTARSAPIGSPHAV